MYAAHISGIRYPPRATAERGALMTPTDTLSADAQSVTIAENILTAFLTVQNIYVKCT